LFDEELVHLCKVLQSWGAPSGGLRGGHPSSPTGPGDRGWGSRGACNRGADNSADVITLPCWVCQAPKGKGLKRGVIVIKFNVKSVRGHSGA